MAPEARGGEELVGLRAEHPSAPQGPACLLPVGLGALVSKIQAQVLLPPQWPDFQRVLLTWPLQPHPTQTPRDCLVNDNAAPEPG